MWHLFVRHISPTHEQISLRRVGHLTLKQCEYHLKPRFEYWNSSSYLVLSSGSNSVNPKTVYWPPGHESLTNCEHGPRCKAAQCHQNMLLPCEPHENRIECSHLRLGGSTIQNTGMLLSYVQTPQRKELIHITEVVQLTPTEHNTATTQPPIPASMQHCSAMAASGYSVLHTVT